MTGQTTRVSVGSLGEEANGDSFGPELSGDGRVVVFQSDASNLVPGDTNGASDVFAHDLVTGQTTRLSVSTTGVEGNGPSRVPAISGDGRVVVFSSDATNLVSDDTNYASDVFAHDLVTGRTTRLSVSGAGAEGNGGSLAPDISTDGGVVVFYSLANNLVAGDTNGVADVFARFGSDGVVTPPPPAAESPLAAGTPPAAASPPGVTPAAGVSPVPGVVADVTRPDLSAVSLVPSVFRAAGFGASMSSLVGTRVGYALSEPARVRFRVERGVSGRRAGGTCVTLTRSNRSRPRCTRYVTLRGSFTDRGEAGQNRFRFSGRLRGRKLTPGRYRLRALATDPAANRSSPKRVKFRIVRH